METVLDENNNLKNFEDSNLFKIANFYFLSASGFFMIFNLVFDLLLSTLFRFLLPESIKESNDEESDEELKLFSPALIDQIKDDEDRKLFYSSSTRTLLSNIILNRKALGEWKINLLSIIQMLSTGLFACFFMYLNSSTILVLLDFSTTNSYRLNNSLILIHSLKTGELNSQKI